MTTVTSVRIQNDTIVQPQPSVTEGVSITSATQAIQQTPITTTTELTQDRVSASWGCLQPIIDCIYNIVESILACFCCCRTTETPVQQPPAPPAEPSAMASVEAIVEKGSVTTLYLPVEEPKQTSKTEIVEESKVDDEPEEMIITAPGIANTPELEGANLMASVLFAKNASRALKQGNELTQDLLKASIEAGIESRKDAGESLSLLQILKITKDFGVHTTQLENGTLGSPKGIDKFSRSYHSKLGMAVHNLSVKKKSVALILERYKNDQVTNVTPPPVEVFTIVYEGGDKHLYHVLDTQATKGQSEIRSFDTKQAVVTYLEGRSPITEQLRTYRINELVKNK